MLFTSPVSGCIVVANQCNCAMHKDGTVLVTRLLLENCLILDICIPKSFFKKTAENLKFYRENKNTLNHKRFKNNVYNLNIYQFIHISVKTIYKRY